MRIPLRNDDFLRSGMRAIALPVMRWFEQQPYPGITSESPAGPVLIINETMAKNVFPQ